MLSFQAGTMITMRRNANNLFTGVAEETPTDSKPRSNANGDVEKVNDPSLLHQKQLYQDQGMCSFWIILSKVDKKAMIRNGYIRIAHPVK